MAFAAENDYALGVYQSSVNGLFLAGFAGAKGSGGSSDPIPMTTCWQSVI